MLKLNQDRLQKVFENICDFYEIVHSIGSRGDSMIFTRTNNRPNSAMPGLLTS